MRRTTLGPVSSAQLNARPGAAPASRASMGAAKRRSIGPLSGASRRVSSTAAARPSATHTHALVPRNSLPRPSVGSSGRRSSAYSGRPSMSARGASGRVADPRPVGDKKFVGDSINALMAFLAESGFDQPINQRALRSPSKKDVYYLFLFIFQLLDPSFGFGERPEEDIIVQLRNLRYPFTLSKTALSSAGSPHSWPAQLAALMWLIELVTYSEMAQKPDYSAQEEEEESGDKSFFEYLGPAYKVFLAGEDEQYSELEKEEAEKREAHNQAIAEQVMDLGRHQQELKHRIEMAKATKALLPNLRQKKADLLSDHKKLEELIHQTLRQKADIEGRIVKHQATLNEKKAGLAALNEEARKFQMTVNNQELSYEEADRIAQESTRLKEQFHTTLQKTKQAEASIFAAETKIAKQQDKIEAQVDMYKEKATGMKLMPKTAKNSLGFDYEIVIDARIGGVEAAKALTQHLKSNTRPTMQELKKARLNRTSAARTDKIHLEAQVEILTEGLKKAVENEQEAASTLRKLEEAIRRERTAREDAVKRTLKEAEEVEVKNEQLLNERATAARREKAKTELEQASMAYADMTRAYTTRIEKDQQQVAKALESCTAHKDMMDQAIASLEKELATLWPAS